MTTIRLVRLVLSVVLVTGAMTATAAAQSNDEVFPFGFEWNFSTPGARANAMGRTFIGMADDATATISNPAGLMSLTRPQLYAEFKNTQLKVDRLSGVDALYTGVTTEFTSQVRSLSFASVSAPINNKLAVGFTVHRFLDYHETFNLAPRGIPNSPTNSALRPVSGSSDFTGNTYAGTVAYMVTNQLRVGVTVGANQFQADSDARRNLIRFGTNYPADRTALFDTGTLVNQSSIHDSKTAVSANVGVLYRINDMVQVGFDFTKAPKFVVQENLANSSGTSFANFPKDVQINVPNHFGFGVSARPTPKLLVAGDVVRTNYSSLSRNTTLIFFDTVLNGSEFTTPDVTEIHVGAEYNVYNMMNNNPIFVRAGVYTNPSHLVTFNGTADRDANSVQTAQYNLIPRKDETRGTVGAGIALGPRAQIDAAYVFGREFVLSAGIRF